MAESEPTYVSCPCLNMSGADRQLSTTGQPMHRGLRQWDAAVREAYAAQQSELAATCHPESCADVQSTLISPPTSYHAYLPVQSCKLFHAYAHVGPS